MVVRMVPSLAMILHSLREGFGFSCTVVDAVLGLHMARPFVAVEVDASMADLEWMIVVVAASCADLELAAGVAVIDASNVDHVWAAVVAEEDD
jgi:hypothetical protein